MIEDSGARREFTTGAVRDIQEGKGRPSLMPLEVVSKLLEDGILCDLADFHNDNDTKHLYMALVRFAEECYGGGLESMLLDVAIHYEEGSKKYGEVNGVPNWKLGIPVYCYLDSAIRHYLKWRRGDSNEPHCRAFVWNVMSCIWEVDYHD